MAEPSVSLYDRLPELYRTRDADQNPPDQLRAFCALLESALGAVHDNIEGLYHDLFIETCADWVVPYIGDLLGNTPLKGAPDTLRRDVADTIPLRRRKGTRGAIELLTYNLTDWGVHVVELFNNLVWAQHLNHQRPDAGGAPPYAVIDPTAVRTLVARGGTVAVRDPAALALLDTPFDWAARLPDVKPPLFGGVYYNLPNLAIFLWRLTAYQIEVTRPSPGVLRGTAPPPRAGQAPAVARFNLHPLGKPVVLFNTFLFDPDARPPTVTKLDGVPGPIPRERLSSIDPNAHPERYVDLAIYDPNDLSTIRVTSDHGLRLHFPEDVFGLLDLTTWTFRGANLCAWEVPLMPPLAAHEVAIDPATGRIVIGLDGATQATALADHLRVTYTYGSVGAVGAQPQSAPALTAGDLELTPGATVVKVGPGSSLAAAFTDVQVPGPPLIIEIEDSEIHDLDPSTIDANGITTEGGQPQIMLGRPLVIRAAEQQRPIIRLLNHALRFRPTPMSTTQDQAELEALLGTLVVRLRGIYLTPSADPTTALPAGDALIARAALRSLEVVASTLDPGAERKLDPAVPDLRAPSIPALHLQLDYGLSGDEAAAFGALADAPEIHFTRSITGPLAVDEGEDAYVIYLKDSIVDGGGAPGATAIGGTGNDPVAGTDRAPFVHVDGATLFGSTHAQEIEGRGTIFTDTLTVFDNQAHCLKYCYFSGHGDRLPQNASCVSAPDAFLDFTSYVFGEPGYGQLSLDSDFRIKERGPQDDQMGAFGFQLDAHKWKNLQIRYREFMPVGVKPLLIPVT